MNRSRIAALLRELADEFDAPTSPAPEESETTFHPPKKVKTPPRPLTDIDRARARKALRKLGVDIP